MRMTLRRTKSFDSTCSESSTVCVHNPSKPLVPPTSILLTNPSNSRTVKKSVRFDETHNVRTKRAANYKAANLCWYTAEEYAFFKASFKQDIKKAAQASTPGACTFRRVLCSAYSSCRGVPADVDTSKTSLLCKMDLVDLEKCFSGKETYFGLEQMAVSVLREERASVRRSQLRFLMKIQKDSSFMTGSAIAETISQGLEPLSRPCRLFAIEKARAVSASA
mmetsp:Transcript_5643/g.11687  ORF Transcript_5643/g.11687 Transcript_5643/m.11687 type:complete len:221 (-) Transcript_5643:76-738(-)